MTVGELAELLKARVMGNHQAEVTGVASVNSASPGDLVFVEEEKHLGLALNSSATAVIARDFDASYAIEKGKAVLVSS
ncbi:MAG: UDP-3-O-(3-hydroxymyristoyl)glucosamine N-acyltransferase, partial [Acidobacteria bacterium]|nr:UDP-3-O-(3-hydroxymyristoyl)glucosamine N-acyltransferase [Acidobacteriota bacterium]